ncbi:MAG: O-antigen/teichoic acid export membrane protein, partial [Arcobacteraceae bacterium]
ANVALLYLLFINFNVLDSYYQAISKNKISVLSRITHSIISGVLKIYLIYINAGLEAFMLIMILDGIIPSVMYFSMFNNKAIIFKIKKYIDLKVMTQLAKDGFPLLLSILMVLIYLKTDILMINYYMTPSDVGVYSASTRIIEILYIAPTIIMTAFMPSLIVLNEKDKTSFLRKYGLLFSFGTLFSLFLTLVFFNFSADIISFLYGIEYQESVDVLKVHIIGLVFAYLGIISSKWFIIMEKQKFTLYRTLLGAFMNILLNMLLIPKYGLTGAAFATVFSQIVASYASNVLSKETRELFIMQTKGLFFVTK